MKIPQQIGSILPMAGLPASSRNLPGASCNAAAPEVTAVIRSYRSDDGFLKTFNPDKQVAYTRDVARAFRGTAPSLGLVARAFGSYTRDNWLDVQLTDLAVFSGCKDKLSERQVQQLIDIIAEEYGYMKVTELMYFFRRFKTGEYGKFYGAVDPITITCALKEFARERLDILRRLEQAEKERRQKSDPGHQRYVRRYEAYRRMCRFYSLNFRSPDFTLGEFREIWWLFNLGYERSEHGYEE